MTLKRKGLLFLPLFFLLCVPPVFSQDGLYLSSPEVKSIRAELENMRLEVLSLRMSQEASLKDSKMHGAGEQIAGGITDVGELGAIGARIEQGSRESSVSAARIEAAIQRIESVLDEAEKKNGVLDHDGCGAGSGGGG